MKESIAKAAVLIEALPYIQKFRGAIVVIKFGGSAMDDLNSVESTLRDVVFMELVGMKPVIVHGGGKRISKRLKDVGIKTVFLNGLRYTCDKTIAVVDDVLHNEVNPKLVKMIDDFGGVATRLSGKEVLNAEKIQTTDRKTGKLIDLGNVAKVGSVNVDKIQNILDKQVVPVISPVGLDKDGNVYNINADMVACRVAEELRARKLVFLSDVPGILEDANDESSLISTMRVTDVDSYIESNIISEGMVPKIRSAVDALNAGTNKVHLIDGRIKHSLLLEIFTDKGIGTQIIH